jgi:hypothetical protein
VDRPQDARAEVGATGTADIEAHLAELEEIATSLADVPDDELSGTLERAVTLLRAINAGIETRARSAGEDAGEAGRLLEGIDLAPFDAAMKELAPMEPATRRPEGDEGR